jgi:hypothetical protein
MIAGLLLAMPAQADGSKFAGSSVTLRHATNANGLNPGADPTWNPYAAAILSFSPVYALPAKLSLSANWDWEGEYTRRDAEPSSFSYGDPTLTLARGALFDHTPTGLSLSGSATLRAGLSEASRAKTRYGALTVGLGLKRSFKVLKGAALSLSLSATGYGHGATHGSSSQSLYSSCSGGASVASFAASCTEELVLHSGSANAYGALTSVLTASVKLPYKLSARVRLGGSWLGTYSESLTDERISYDGPSGTSVRSILISDVRLSAAPIKRLGVALGLQNAHPQLGADGRYRTPFVNRYSNLYLDLTARF